MGKHVPKAVGLAVLPQDSEFVAQKRLENAGG